MMTPTQWREAGQLIKVGDHNIFYIRAGIGIKSGMIWESNTGLSLWIC